MAATYRSNAEAQQAALGEAQAKVQKAQQLAQMYGSGEGSLQDQMRFQGKDDTQTLMQSSLRGLMDALWDLERLAADLQMRLWPVMDDVDHAAPKEPELTASENKVFTVIDATRRRILAVNDQLSSMKDKLHV